MTTHPENRLDRPRRHRLPHGLPQFRGSRRRLASLRDAQRGAATAEYAVATMAAVGFAGLLVVILRSDEVRGILTDLIRAALSVAG